MNTPDTEWEEIVDKIEELYQSGKYDADFRKKLIIITLTSHTTYWKERVRKGVEGMKKDFVPADLIWEGDEEQEVGEWKYVPKEGGMYCLNCERFVPEEGCICGVISFEALYTLLDNLK